MEPKFEIGDVLANEKYPLSTKFTVDSITTVKNEETGEWETIYYDRNHKAHPEAGLSKIVEGRNKLKEFYKEAQNPNWIIAKSSLNQIAFAIKYASDEAIEQFMEWLFDGEDYPISSSMDRLNNGYDSYEDNFERITENWWEQLTVEVTDPQDKDEVESAIFTEIDSKEPYGLDSNSTCIYYSQGNKWYVTTDFGENGEPNKNPIIAVAIIEKKGKKKMSSFRINSKIIDKLKVICEHDHRSQSSEIEYLINERYSQIKKK